MDEDLRGRFKIVATTIMNYSIELLCWENYVELPKDLESHEAANLNSYTVVLFNDELHTFDELSSSLVEAIPCQTKDAEEFTSIVDREGRATVKVGRFEDCKKIEKNIVEQTICRSAQARPVKCEVIQMPVVAHQEHAIQLLDWLNRIIRYHEGLRLAFGHVMQSNVFTVVNSQIVQLNILERIMINDANLWKTARSSVHILLMNVMLNPKTKKFCAKSLTKLYDQLIQGYISDINHNPDASFLIIRLSPLIYSVPSMAHLIIEEDDALHLISESFYKECEKFVINGKLVIKRDQANRFRRAHAVLTDLTYLLVTRPVNWTKKLRKSFLHGFETIMIILKWMQDIDSIIRQDGQHLEMNWEVGILL